MKNDPVIHAKASKIVEAIKDISHRAECTLEKMWFEVSDDEPLECSCDYKYRLTEALASLKSSEREVSNKTIIDATNIIRALLNNWEDATDVNISKAQDALDLIQRTHPSEREVLMGFIEWMYLVYGTPLNEKTIETYLAEKHKTEKK